MLCNRNHSSPLELDRNKLIVIIFEQYPSDVNIRVYLDNG